VSAGTRAIAALPALAIVSVSLWEAWAAHHATTSVPGDDDWRRAAEYVRSKVQPGDLIVFAPEWVDPVGRMVLGDKLAVADAARMDAAKYARIWELSIRGARSPDTAGLQPVARTEGGGVEIRRYERTPAHVLADVRDLLPGAKVTGGAAHRELAEVGFAPHDCVEVTPVPKQPVRIVFPHVALGTKLVGYVGLADVFTRRDIRAPGKLAVEIDGTTVTTISPGVEDGWVRFEVATTPGAGDIAFVASADAPQRLICFGAEARE
jgi:hypothetical protein